MKDTYEDKTKEQLIREIENLRQMNAKLEVKLKQQAHDNVERVKELNCLYGISRLVEVSDISLEGMLQKIVNVIPLSWQYPEITCARLILGDKVFKTDYFEETIWKQSCNILFHGNRIGNLEVYYLEERPENDEGPFLKEERNLINAIAERLGKVIEHKLADEKLHKNERKYKTLLENLPQKIFHKDRNSVYVSCNKNYAEDLKIKPDEIVGKTDYDFYSQELAEKYRADDKRVIESGNVETIEERYIQDGKEVIVQTVKTPIKDDQENVTGILGIFWDITERKKAEEALRKSEERYQNLLENANDAIISINREGMIIGFNKKAEEMFCYAREEILGKPPYLLAPHQNRENQKKVLEKFKEIGNLLHIDKKIMEAIGLKKDGKEFPAEFSHYIFEHYGEVIFSAIVRDISERKIAEQRLIEYQNQLRSLASQLTLAEEHERRRFATYLHDHIGQTLFGIHLKLDLLKHSLSTNDDIKHLKAVMNSIQQMIKDTRLLTFELSPPILYESNLESALDSLTERMHEQYGIMVTLKNDKQEKPLDDDIKVFLFQAVRELLINVVKHAQAKSVSIAIQKENTRIRIHVEDDGVGFIPLSNDFSQNQHKGFGLFSIRERLNYLGGSLEVNSQPGHGTKITIFSPLRAKKRKSNGKNISKRDNVIR